MDFESGVVDMRKRGHFNSSSPMTNKRLKHSPNSSTGHAEDDSTERQQAESKPSSSLGEPVGAETDFSETDENDNFNVCEDEDLDESLHLVSAPNSMDPALRELIRKYVRADYVIHCLELAGFDSAAVFACLGSEANIRQLEVFVGSTCALINSNTIRQYFLGPVYARHPTSFKLPAGVVCGLRLAVEELKRTDLYTTPSSLPFNAISDAATQTEASSVGPSSLTSSSEGSPSDPSFTNVSDSTLIPPPAHISSDNLSFGHPSLPPSSLSVNEGNCKRLLDCMRGRFSLPSQHSPQSRNPCSSTTADNIDVERLIHHSSASACRLAARQFVNANLVRGKHFDMQMEVSGGENGQKRVTGIFYCHLCREKRERTCAVRFSVARNRYPVMSNVLSHLKTHFQYQSSANATSNNVAVGGLKKLPASVQPPPSVSPSTLIDSSTSSMTSAGTPFFSPNTFCNLVSRVVQFAASANAPLQSTEVDISSQASLTPLPPLPSKLSPVN